ncbi:MAG: hypothetical protein KC415_16790, partial [Anaerolineales bacterium]|nr:hypothetical protein [Anaerolineales bacterium]
MRRLIILLIGVLLLAACADSGDEPPVPLALEPTGTPLPTPTLVPALATWQPTATPDATPALNVARPKPTPSPTATPSPTPSPTPLPATRLAASNTYLQNGNDKAAINELEAVLSQRSSLTPSQTQSTLYSLG